MSRRLGDEPRNPARDLPRTPLSANSSSYLIVMQFEFTGALYNNDSGADFPVFSLEK